MHKKFYVITDHASLATSANKGESPRIQQWLERLELEFEFEILYRAGTRNKVADCLSREIASQLEERKTLTIEEKKPIILPVTQEEKGEWIALGTGARTTETEEKTEIEAMESQTPATQSPASQEPQVTTPSSCRKR